LWLCACAPCACVCSFVRACVRLYVYVLLLLLLHAREWMASAPVQNQLRTVEAELGKVDDQLEDKQASRRSRRVVVVVAWEVASGTTVGGVQRAPSWGRRTTVCMSLRRQACVAAEPCGLRGCLFITCATCLGLASSS
jgi:hypothetical protein